LTLSTGIVLSIYNKP